MKEMGIGLKRFSFCRTPKITPAFNEKNYKSKREREAPLEKRNE